MVIQLMNRFSHVRSSFSAMAMMRYNLYHWDIGKVHIDYKNIHYLEEIIYTYIFICPGKFQFCLKKCLLIQI